MSVTIQVRRDTAANWTSTNPTLNQGEIGFETDSGKVKIGDGSTAWTSLAYFAGSGGGAVSSVFGRTGTVTAQSGDYTAADVGADASGSASTAQSNAETFATSAVATETSRAETAEALLAPKASPTFTGTPAAPTASALTDSTQVATTAYADSAVAVETSRAETAEALAIPLTQKAAASGVATLDSGTHVPVAQLPAATTGAQGAVQFDATVTDLQPDGAAALGSTGKAPDAGHIHPLQPWQLTPEAYGAKGNCQLISDAAITATQNTLTTAGVANPTTAPTLATSGSNGTILAGAYGVKYTYATAFGETTASSSASQTTTGSTSTITVTAPASNGVPGGAIGVNYYFTLLGGSTYYKQNAAPWPFQNNYIQVAPPATTTQPPGSNTTASAPFVLADVGKSVRVIGAGTAGADLLTTISGYTSSSQVTLTANAVTTVARSGFVWTTDDTAAINSWLAALQAYAAASGNATAEGVCRPVIYGLATAPVVGGAFGGNCVLQLPSPPQSGPKLKIAIRGMSQDAATLLLYQQMVPEVSGTTFMYIGAAGTNSATFSAASVFGTPTNPAVYVNESGTIPGFVNMKMVMDSIRVVVPWAGGIGGIDLTSAAESDNRSCSTMALGIVPSGGSWTQITANGPATNQWGWGLREPGAGNNAFSYTEQFTCEGLCYGYGPSEHVVAVNIFTAYCVTGIETYAGNGISMVHNGHIVSAGAEFCTNAVGAFDGGVRMDIDNLRTESTSKIIFDTSNRVQGRFGVRDQGAAGAYKSGWANGGTGVTLINLMTIPGPLASPQAPPATTVAWVNYYYRDAWITVALSGGNTFTSLNIASVAQPNAAGAATYSFMLGAGQSYTPAYSAGTLTHTVALL